MLSSEAAAVVAAQLAPLNLPVITYPADYGTGGVESFNWYVTNHPGGWLAVRMPRSFGQQGYLTDWTVTIDAAARTDEDARRAAHAVQRQLMSLTRTPTSFLFMGDVRVSDGKAVKYVLTFTARLKQPQALLR